MTKKVILEQWKKYKKTETTQPDKDVFFLLKNHTLRNPLLACK